MGHTNKDKDKARMTTFPKIDAHFWVEREGKIIDFDFEEYKFCKKFWNCEENAEPIYLSAPPLTQSIAIKVFDKVLMNTFKQPTIEKSVEEMYKLYKKVGLDKPSYGSCYMNAIIEIYENGGTLVFGSMGWRRRNGDIHYEFGGTNYLTWKDFTK